MTKSQEQRMNELATNYENELSQYENYYDQNLIVKVYIDAYKAAMKEAEVLVEALNKIEEILCSQTYNNAFEILEEALKKFKGD